MTNWKKDRERFEMHLERRTAWEKNYPKEAERREAELKAQGCDISSEEVAAQLEAEEGQDDPCVMALAADIRADTPLPDCAFEGMLLRVRDKQRKMRHRYGPNWHGVVKWKDLKLNDYNSQYWRWPTRQKHKDFIEFLTRHGLAEIVGKKLVWRAK